MEIIKLNPEEFEALHAQGEVVSQHGVYGPKVFTTKEGDYIKVFNPKPGLTKRHFFPKYKKFIANAEKLKQLGIKTVTVKQIYFLEKNQNYAVRYEPLPGKSLRSLVDAEGGDVIYDFLPFLIKLHNLGIYFRGLHLGNVLKISKEEYGLIDATDLSFRSGPLSAWHRVRNIAHLFKTQPDDKAFKAYGLNRFMQEYIEMAKLSRLKKAQFLLAAKLYRLGS